MWNSAEGVLLIIAVILLMSILAGKAGFKFGLPLLLVFLGVGMFFGADGLGIEFADYSAAQFIGMLALSIILFSGGMDTKRHEINPILAPGIVLATMGVLLTTLFTACFIYFTFSLFTGDHALLTFPQSLLLAAIMSSTDSASVFSILRSKSVRLKQNLRPVLELESGSNDPMAYMLTIFLITCIQAQGEISIGSALLSFGVQFVVGTVLGLVFGKGIVFLINRIAIKNPSLYPLFLLASVFLTFAVTTLCKGNGYLAVYIAGLIVGNTRIIHKRSIVTIFDGFTWLCQIIMFITLGLLINPRELIPIFAEGLAIGVFMILVARPLSVFLCLIPFKRFTTKAKLYISWVGLRGAVPIIFATYPLIADVEHSYIFFNIVFFITILSLLVQGTTVTLAAKWLGVITESPKKKEFDIELPDDIKSAMQEMLITHQILSFGNKLMDLPLPDHTLAVLVKREDVFFVPKGNTELRLHDTLLLIADNEVALRRAFEVLGVSELYEKNITNS